MSKSIRQSPPPDRSSLYAALVVVGLLTAGLLGWMVSSMLHSGDAKRESRLNQKQAAKAVPPNSTDADSSSGGKPKENEREPAIETAAEKPSTSAGASHKDRGKDRDWADPAELEKELSRGPPKLSSLDSFRNNPRPTRIRAGDRRKSGQTGKSDSGKATSKTPGVMNPGKQPGEPANSDSTRDKEKRPAKDGSQEFLLNESGNQFALPQSTKPLVFFQELVVDRNPSFGIEGLSEISQRFKYRVVSRIAVQPRDSRGFRQVTQEVVAANLVSADSMSKKSIVESVKKLVGKEFRYTLDRKQQLVEFKGEKEKPRSIDFKDLTSIEGLTGDGFMVSSVMDLDGWREMAQLTFLLPDDRKKKWKTQMGHDWGELGKWVGETHFEKKAETNGLLRIDYAHWMKYDPASGEKSSLPFTISEKAFESTEAGGALYFDTRKKRIDSLIERFRVSGQIGASLLGGSTKLRISETQTFELKLHDQQPQ
ncbi:MAG: hypothetical protein VX768_07010 [Planctomycetota bacterium]|nr:hypothetical protein [Planctomycetota bacterium]